MNSNFHLDWVAGIKTSYYCHNNPNLTGSYINSNYSVSKQDWKLSRIVLNSGKAAEQNARSIDLKDNLNAATIVNNANFFMS